MPGPVIKKPQFPEWMDPAKPGTGVGKAALAQALFKRAVGMMGLDDPHQVMGVATPNDDPPHTTTR